MKGYLTKDGITEYSIKAERITVVVLTAEDTLKRFLKQSCGVDFVIDNDNENSAAIILRIDGEESALQSEGFIIKTEGKNIYIIGKTDLGVLYGVYEFLERVCGIRFLTKDYTYVPKLKDIPFPKFNEVQNPAFEMRSFLSFNLSHNAEFSSQLRLNNEWLKMPDEYGGNIGIYPYCHNILTLIEPSKYYKKHPEWFFVLDGKIKDLCYSHLGILSDGGIDETYDDNPIKIAAQNFAELILKPENKKYLYFHITQQDTYSSLIKCNCDDCLTQDEFYGRSGMMIRFVNAVNRETKKILKSRDIKRKYKIITFAYLWSFLPPWDYSENKPLDPSVVPDDNVYVRIAPIDEKCYYGHLDKSQISSVRNAFTFWQKITKNIMVWDYCIDFAGYLIYMPTARHWKRDLSNMKKMNAKYVMFQSAHNEPGLWQDDIKAYIASKMLWNIDADYRELREEFIDLYFAESSVCVKEFIKKLDVQYEKMLGDKVPILERPSTRTSGCLVNAKFYDARFWEEEIAVLNKAMDIIRTSDNPRRNEIEKKLTAIMLTPFYMLAMEYDKYYPNDPVEKEKFLNEFFSIYEKSGMVRYRENKTQEQLKELLLSKSGSTN